MTPPERPEPDSSYAETVAATAAEFGFETELAEVIVGPDDEHCDDRVEALRVIRDRVCGAWDDLTPGRAPMTDSTKNEFIKIWLCSIPQSEFGSGVCTLLKTWERDPMGYVEVMEETQAHAEFTDSLREGEGPTTGYYIA